VVGTPPRTVAIVGPTAMGKTPLAVAVALCLGHAELLNADSRQVIRGLVVGTCAPMDSELRGVPCHLLGFRDPQQPYSVADWVAGARAVLAQLDGRGIRAIVVGGTGLYVSALVDGLDLAGVPPNPARRRQRLEASMGNGGVDVLGDELRDRDPQGAAAVDLRNPRRVIRALEILDARGGQLRAARGRVGGRDALLIGLDAPRDVADQLIEVRSRRMLESGALIDEVHSAMARGIPRDALESAGIGYREALAVVDGSLTLEAAVDALIRRTRRYAKTQRTWFRRDPRIRWLERGAGPTEALVDEVIDAIHQDARSGQRLSGR
jgi:tRNA dimethylallyltransferase